MGDYGLIAALTDNVNINQLTQERAETSIPENITHLLEDLPTVNGDRDKLAQVFQNLFEKVVTYEKPSKIEIKQLFSKTGALILVSNDEEPIFPENRAEIFR